MKKPPSEQSAVRLVFALQEGYECTQLRVAGNVASVRVKSPCGEVQVVAGSAAGDADWLGDLLDQAKVPNYTA